MTSSLFKACIFIIFLASPNFDVSIITIAVGFDIYLLLIKNLTFRIINRTRTRTKNETIVHWNSIVGYHYLGDIQAGSVMHMKIKRGCNL